PAISTVTEKRGAQGELQRGVAEHVVDRPAPGAIEWLAAEDLAVHRAGVVVGTARVKDKLDGVPGTEEVVVIARLPLRQVRQRRAVRGRGRVERPAGVAEGRGVRPGAKRREPIRRQEAHARYAPSVRSAIVSQSNRRMQASAADEAA